MRQVLRAPILWLSALLLIWLFATPYLAPLYAWAFPETEPSVYQGDSLADLFLWHALFVIVASVAAIIRVHDVGPHVDAMKMFAAIGHRPERAA